MKRYSLIKRGNSRRILRTKRFITIALIFLVLLMAGLLVPRVVSVMAAVFWYPVDAVKVWVRESNDSLPTYLRERARLQADIEELQATIARQSGTDLTIRRLQEENTAFRNLLGALPEERTLARVIGRPNQLPYDMLLIDRGARHGIVEQAPVFLGRDQVVGFVSQVRDASSVVTLISHPGLIATAYIFGPNIFTLTEGMGGGIVRVRVPQGIRLKQGDLVVFPALDSGVYGEIFSVATSPTQPEQFGYVAPLLPIQSMYYVSIGADPIRTNTFAEAQTTVQKINESLLVVDLPDGVLVTPQDFDPDTPTTTAVDADVIDETQ